MLNGLDLFSGIGNATLALSPWVRPVAYCEKDGFANAVLLSRMADQVLPEAPIWDDVTTLSKADWPWWFGAPDIIYGGFPCQDISSAGHRAGLAGERSGLFFEVVRLVGEFRPRFVFLENVADVTARGLDRIAAEFSALRYDCRWGMLSAFDVGAPHERERWFLLAHAQSDGVEKQRIPTEGRQLVADPFWRRWRCEASHSDRTRLAHGNAVRRAPEEPPGRTDIAGCGESWWLSEPAVGRVVDGFADSMDRARHICGLHALGNGVPPQHYREAFQRLSGLN